ncbi:E3 ubiquitin protein ligase DRIP2-like [Phalaenopsis equestris]|uniref:E3 ubiquitin protein ligase DRIP2-like n=1 Tax=Phalaenopsis equestris TaxID=78828 RepID=UPI0009E290F5|nr:E3 ubiquitin protein ligase DRIP2-like [Phalaenopsis equestris]
MTPARNHLLWRCDNYGVGRFADSHFIFHSPLKPLLMAEEGAGNGSSKKPAEKEKEQEGPREEERAQTYEAGWLQLGPGASASASSTELRLFPERPPQASMMASTSSVLAPAAGDDLRVVSPPQRVRTGIWIALRPAENQVNAPFLPQLPKSYLRIKDGRMTIRLLMRYLANKLGLQDESEVEITCRSQQLMPFATLEDVRDHIWFVRDTEAPGPSSPATEHVMKLYYSRRA